VWPAENWSENFKEISQNTVVITYTTAGSIALEYAVIDLHIGTTGKNSTALEVACPPPDIGAKK
jgi:hypothetical protein